MYVRLIVIGLALASSGWLGYRVADGRCAAAMLALANDRRDAQNAAIEAANTAAKAERERAVRAAEERGRRSVAAREIVNEIHVSADCEWSDDQRLRLQRIHDLYRAPAADRVPDPLQPTPESGPAS